MAYKIIEEITLDPGRDYVVNEGNYIGGEEAQPIGSNTIKIVAVAPITKGQVLTFSHAIGDTTPWGVAPSQIGTPFAGIAFNSAEVGEIVTLQCEGFVKLLTSTVVNVGDTVVTGADGTINASNDMSRLNECIGTVFSTGRGYTNGLAEIYVKIR